MGFFGRYVRQTAEMNAQRGTLNIMLETEVQSLDPQVATDGTSFEVIADYTDGLMQMDADGAAVPAIAETYDISEDGKTLEVQLNVPVSYFLSLMYFPTFYPVNEAFYNTCKDTFGTSPDTVLSNGAFKLTDYQPAATAFTLEKNPDYYDAGKIALDGLAYQVIKDSQQALMSYQTGALDMTLLNGEQVDQVKDDPEGRWAALYEAEQIVLEQAVIFPLYGQCNAEMISSAVKGVEHHPCALNRVYKNTTKSE